LTKGYRYVESGPLVRSSYHAEKHVFWSQVNNGIWKLHFYCEFLRVRQVGHLNLYAY
jgi:hypothetical protein